MKNLSLVLLINLFLLSCGSENNASSNTEDLSKLTYKGKKAGNNAIIIHELSDPDKLNPITSQGAGATYIEHNIFMYLLDVDKEKLEVIPWLAKSRPVITEITEGKFAGGLKIDYELKAEAVWDNGSPVTAEDVAFSMKATMNPHVDAEHQRPYIDFVKHIEIDKENPKKFSFFTKEKNYAAEFSTGGTIYTIPEYIYDKEGLMRNFSLSQLSDEDELSKIQDDKNLIKFAHSFNSENFQRETVVGCGAYYMEKWETSQRVVLKKKENWWGEKYKDQKSFENYPKELIYEIINDKVTAITAMKDESIDIMRGMRPVDYANLSKNVSFNEKFFLSNPESLSYTYVGLNMKNIALKDKNVRKALAHLVDVKQIIKILRYGYAKEMSSFVHPSKKHYNDTLKPYAYDLNKTIDYLEKAGWTNKDASGIRTKMIDGKEEKLSFVVKYNSGNDTRETIAIMLKENAKKVGIDIEIIVREWSVYLDDCKNHNFDMFILGWVQEAILDDPKQLFHTDAYHGGSNYVGFGNEKTDRLIEKIRTEMNEAKRIEMLKDLQAIIRDEVPYIFLYSPDNLLAISKRFGESKTYIARPGYDERETKLAPIK